MSRVIQQTARSGSHGRPGEAPVRSEAAGLIRQASALGLAAILAATLVGSSPHRASASDPAVASVVWEVRVSDPAMGLVRVTGVIPVAALAGASTLTLRYPDLRVSPERLKELRARTGERVLEVERAEGAARNVWQVELGATDGNVVVEYTIDPTYYPPGSQQASAADARSRVTERLAIVRTASLLPVVNAASAPLHVSFTLPDGWVAVTPWGKFEDGYTVDVEAQGQVEYLGLGPFQLTERTLNRMTFRVAVLRDQVDISVDDVAAVVRFESDLISAPPAGAGGTRSVIVVPPDFMRGGAAGGRSVVLLPSPVVLAHEVFHWWTHPGLTRPEGRWFTEGFTNYYGVKVARAVGLITQDEARACLADLAGEMRYLERAGARSLAAASLRYGGDAPSRRLVYSKGTLLALLLDQQLDAEGRSLDEVMGMLLEGGRQRMTNVELQRVFSEAYGRAVGLRLEAYVVQAEMLPSLGLGAAEWNSGCARYGPEG